MSDRSVAALCCQCGATDAVLLGAGVVAPCAEILGRMD